MTASLYNKPVRGDENDKPEKEADNQSERLCIEPKDAAEESFILLLILMVCYAHVVAS